MELKATDIYGKVSVTIGAVTLERDRIPGDTFFKIKIHDNEIELDNFDMSDLMHAFQQLGITPPYDKSS